MHNLTNESRGELYSKNSLFQMMSINKLPDISPSLGLCEDTNARSLLFVCEQYTRARKLKEPAAVSIDYRVADLTWTLDVTSLLLVSFRKTWIWGFLWIYNIIICILRILQLVTSFNVCLFVIACLCQCLFI